MKNILKSIVPIFLLTIFITLNGIAQKYDCSMLQIKDGLTYVNNWVKKGDTSVISGIILFTGECYSFTKNHFRINRVYKDGKLVSSDSFIIPYIIWRNHKTNDSISLKDLKKLKKFNLINQDNKTSWKIKTYDLYFTKHYPVIRTDSMQITKSSAKVINGKGNTLNKEMSDYLKNAKYNDFDVFTICHVNVINYKGDEEEIDSFVLYLKRDKKL